MKRQVAGMALVLGSAMLSPTYLLRLLLSVATLLNEQTWMMLFGALLLLRLRAGFMFKSIWNGVSTRLSEMHLFYGGIASVLFSIIVLSFLPGTFIVTTLTALFSGTTLTGYQILQGLVFVVGVMLVIFDFPFGYVKGMRGRSR